MIGAYVPQCTENGDYNPEQCSGSTGMCWCVNQFGHEISDPVFGEVPGGCRKYYNSTGCTNTIELIYIYFIIFIIYIR